MKGLFKGLRKIFEEEEKEEEIQIGLPTDVKHVAHIGWDGPAASAPTWMDDFKSSPTSESSSAPIQANGVANGQADDVNLVSQDRTKKKIIKDSQNRDLSNFPKSSRRQSSADSTGSGDSHGSPTKKSKPNRRRQTKGKECSSPKQGESPSYPPNVPKKARRKKSKDIDRLDKSKSKEKESRHGSDDMVCE